MAAAVSVVWDYDLDEEGFERPAAGRRTLGRLDRDWAAVRLLEYASYSEIRRLLSLRDLVAGWPSWRHRIRYAHADGVGRRRGSCVVGSRSMRPDLL